MEIRNPTQMASFVQSNGLDQLNMVFRQLVICIGDFVRHCDCHSRADKDKIYLNCKRLYNHAASLAHGTYKDQFLNATTERQIAFYTEGGILIGIASR